MTGVDLMRDVTIKKLYVEIYPDKVYRALEIPKPAIG